MLRIALLTLPLIFFACNGKDKAANDDDTSVDETDADTDADADSDTDTDTDTDSDTDSDTDTDINRIACPDTVAAPPSGEICGVDGNIDNATHVFIQGTVLAGDDLFENGGVLFDNGVNGRIECVGCGCGSSAPSATVTVSCPEGVVSPGLINAHDHIRYALEDPAFPPNNERYDHRHDWRTGARGHTELNASPTNTREAVLYGEARMLFGGVTSIAGSISSVDGDGLLRNVDDEDHNDGLGNYEANYSTFPLGDTSGTLSSSGCSAYSVSSPGSALSDAAYLPHIAEGIDPEANNEFLCTSSNANGGEDLIAEETAVIHGIGLTPLDISLMAAKGAKLIWSPRSNVHLYGQTAPVIEYDNLGVRIAMGTDWVPSGSATMLRELQCADYLNINHFDSHFSDRDLWKMATINGAAAVGAGDDIGLLDVGYLADIAVFDGSMNADYRAVLDANQDDVVLVMRGSEPLFGDDAVMTGLIPSADTGLCDSIDGCSSRAKRECIERDTSLSVNDLRNSVGGGAYPLYECLWQDEPSCVPRRNNEDNDGSIYPLPAGQDFDGDGVLDAVDNCPDHFNPPRPLEGDQQGDWDNDGEGDVCDICPLDDNQVCTLIDPDDLDGDGIGNLSDNCPNDDNPNQDDGDSDGIGDVCDPCPSFTNAMGACPATVYETKTGAKAGAVVVADLLVTAVSDIGAFVQHDPSASSYAGADDSATFVFLGNTDPSLWPERGDAVTIEATTDEFFGQKQLTDPWAVTVHSSNNPLPAALVVTTSEVATGGAKADAYNALLLRVDNVEVSDIAPTPGPAQSTPTNEFELIGGLRVNDHMFLIDPFPTVGETFDSITGVLRWNHDNTKLEPRDALDVASGPPAIAPFEPQVVYIEANTTDDTLLLATVNRIVSVDTVIELDCQPAATLTCPATVTIPTGSNTVAVELEGGTANATPATITANIQGTPGETEVADVYVYDDGLQRSVIDLQPDPLDLTTNTTGQLTLTLDLPAPTGGVDVVVADSSGFVTVSSPVNVPAGMTTASFDVTAGGTDGADIVTATLNGTVAVDVNVSSVSVGTNLFFSQYMEGASDNKIVEIYNAQGSTVDLSNCNVLVYANGNSTPNNTIGLSGSLSAGATYEVCNSSEAITTPGTCDLETGALGFNGNDAVELECGGETLDVFGKIGEDPGSNGWGAGTKDVNLLRSCSQIQGDPDGSDDFDPATEWTNGTQDDPADLESYCP